MPTKPLIVLLASALLIGIITPAATANALQGETIPQVQSDTTDKVNVTIGHQLSTITTATDSDVRTEFEETRLEIRIASANESDKAATMASRAAELRQQATAIHEAYQEANRAYQAGEIDRSEYARRIAILNARAENLATSVDRLRTLTDEVTIIDLRAAGITRSDLHAITTLVDKVTGSGAAALLQRFTGRTDGEVRIDTRSGLSIEFEGRDGRLSRELDRDHDNDSAINISHEAALRIARNHLRSPPNGTWHLLRTGVNQEEGYYRFQFGFRTPTLIGEAKVRVDGSTGEVYRLETEIEPRHDRSDRDTLIRDTNDDLTLVITNGSVAPGHNVMLTALDGHDPVSGAVVTLNDRRIGRTDEQGQLPVTLPRGEAEFIVTAGDAEGELELEFGDDARETDELRRHFNVQADSTDGIVTIRVLYAGSPVEGASVTIDGRHVGTTDAEGTVRFADSYRDEFETEIQKGAFVAMLDFESQDGMFVLSEVEFEEASVGTEQESDNGEEDRVRDLSIHVIEGSHERGSMITVEVTSSGSPVSGALVSVNDERIGETNEKGHLQIQIPQTDEVEISTEYGGEYAEIEIEFGTPDR